MAENHAAFYKDIYCPLNLGLGEVHNVSISTEFAVFIVPQF